MFETINFNKDVAIDLDESGEFNETFNKELRGKIREEILEGGQFESDDLEIFITRVIKAHKMVDLVEKVLNNNDYFLELYEDR